MAFKEVTSEPGEGGEFVRFNAIGDKMQGVFMGTSPSTGQYAKEGDKVFKFLCRDGAKMVVKNVDGPANAQVKLKKAEREGRLEIGVVAKLAYVSNQDTGQASPMRVIQLLIDLDEAGKPIVTPAALDLLKKHGAAAPAAKPKPKADDALFGDDGAAPAAGDDEIPF